MPGLTLADLEKKWLQEQYAPGLSRNLPVALVKENLVKNPSFETNTTDWTAIAGTGGVAALTRPAGGYTGGFFGRSTWSVATTSPSGAFAYGPIDYAFSGKTFTYSVVVRSNIAQKVKLRIEWKTEDNVFISYSDSPVTTLVANTWAKISFTAVAPANAGKLWVWGQVDATGLLWAINDTLDVDAMLFNEGTNSDYFDGDTVDTYNTDYSWTGVAHASTSKSTLTSARENLVKNPSLEVSTSQYAIYYGVTGAGNLTRPAGGYIGGFFCRATWTVASTTSSGGFDVHPVDLIPVAAGKTYTASGMIRTNTAQSIYCRIRWKDAAQALISYSASGITLLVANTWTKLSVTGVAPANAATAEILFYANTGLLWNIGDTLDIDAVLFNEGTNSNYFDGDTTDFYNVDHTWTGAAHASTSKLTTSPMGITLRENLVKNPSIETDLVSWSMSAGTTGVAALTRVAGGFIGGFFARNTWSVANTAIGGYIHTGISGSRLPVVVGKTYTASAMVRSNVAQRMQIDIDFRDIVDAFISTSSGTSVVLVPNTWTKIQHTFVVPANAVGCTFLNKVNVGAGILWAIGDTFDIDAVLFTEGSDSTYFDGDTADFTNGNYVWTGTAHASTSRLHAPEPVLAENLNPDNEYQLPAGSFTSDINYKGLIWQRLTGNPSANRRCLVPLAKLSNGVEYTSSCLVANDGASPVTVGIDWCDANQVFIAINPGEVKRIRTSGVGQAGGYDNTYRFTDIDLSSSQNILFRDFMVQVGNVAAPVYFDGDSPGAYWTGVAHASTSRLIDVQSRELMYLESEFYKRRSGLPAGSSFGYHERAYLIANYVDVGMGPDPNKLTNNDLQVSRYRNGSDLVPKEKFSYADHEKRMYELALGL